MREKGEGGREESKGRRRMKSEKVRWKSSI